MEPEIWRVDRRGLLKRAGALSALGVVPGFLAACGSEDAGGGGGESGGSDAIKIGYVTPATGALAPFAEADEFILGGVRSAWGEGLRTRDGTRPVEIIVKDSQSNPDRAGAVASDLILQDKVDLVVVASTPETVNPVSDQCELNGMPCISSVAPWQAWFLGRGGAPDKPFRFTYHFFWGADDLVNVYMDMWGQVDAGKTAGMLMPNDSDGNALADKATGFPPALTEAGYRVVDPGRYENGTNDFSAQINRFRSGGADILTGVPIPPDFTTFWKQAAQQGYRPPVATIAKAVLFPSAVEALGDIGEGISTEVWWSPEHPFSSSLTDTSAKDLASEYTSDTGRQWTQPIGFVHALFEVVGDVLAKVADPKDRQAVAQQIGKTRLETVVGMVDWTSGPVANVAKTPLTGGQWRRGSDGLDLVIVSNAIADQIPKADDLQRIA